MPHIPCLHAQDVDGTVLSVARAPPRKKRDPNDQSTWMHVSSSGDHAPSSVRSAAAESEGHEQHLDMEMDIDHFHYSSALGGIEEDQAQGPIQVVLDAANIAMHDVKEDCVDRHISYRMEASRIVNAINYFRSRGIRCAAFIPAYCLRRKGASSGGGGKVENVMMQSETQEILQSLVDRRAVATCPPTDNDDVGRLVHR